MTNSRSHGAVVLSLSLLLLSACATEETMTGGGSTPSSSAAMKASAQAYDSLQSFRRHGGHASARRRRLSEG
jgi:outer membrane biogenesis lipoprotein LolB